MGSTVCEQSFDCANDVRSLIDRLDLAVDSKITDVCMFPLRRGFANSSRSSPELNTDSPVYRQIIKIASPPDPPAVRMSAEADAHTETPKFRQRYSPSLIDSLDLAVDCRITGVEPLQLRPRRKHAVSFRSSVELRVHSPVYGAAVKTVPLVAAVVDILQNSAARPDRRRSVWKRSKRFMWKSMVNVARRICFCQSFLDLE